ncbi:glycosyl hydrolase catalytic core-domain-containing protein [Mucidula mucida]|nr:glycosyl hydrolase catalytic core-domain-containing protein [Mucidula mucida]
MLAHTLFCFFALVVPASAHWDTNSSASDNISSATSANFSVSTTATASAASQSSSNSTSSDSASSLSTNSTDSTEKATKNPKRGLSFPAANNPADVLNINQTRSVVSWTYDWSITPPDYLADTGVEYVPMQWGAGNIESLASIMSKTGAKTLLTFNEPDFDEQSNMDPTYAADQWMKYIEPLKSKGVRLGGPAVTSSPTGRPWLSDFFAACQECSIDFLPLHWYGVGSAGFYDYLWSIHGQWPDLKLWITEYADTGSDYQDVLTFMNTTAAYMDTLDWVERYAWFGYFVGFFVNYTFTLNNGYFLQRPENGSFYSKFTSSLVGFFSVLTLWS